MFNKSAMLPSGLAIIVFCLSVSTAFSAELQLGGIRLAGSAMSILQKYGNPNDIRIGATVQVETVPTMAFPGMPAATPFPGVTPGTTTFPGTPPAMGLPGMFPMPPAPAPAAGFPAPGTPSAPSLFAPPQPQATPVISSGQTKTAPEVTWIYRFSENRELSFILSPDGRVIQIAAFGAAWPGVGTSKGIRLGDTYKDVVMKYGYPESHERSGIEMTARYPEKHRAIFTFVGKNLVGITIALMD